MFVAMGRQDARNTYRADIDGLRAVAVLAVVLFHVFPGVVHGGFVGVDIFFVISGFLISGIIRRDVGSGTFDFLEFYGRRVRRIFPALILTLAATLGYGLVVLMPAELAQLGRHVVAGAGFASNLVLWGEAGYFDRASFYKPLLHLWSLGIEEQFYLVWPLVLWGLARYGAPQMWIMVTITGVSFILNLVASGRAGVADFYSPVTRLWELSAGGMLASWLDRAGPLASGLRANRLWRRAAALVGAGLITMAVLFIGRQGGYPGWQAVLPVMGAGLLIAAGPAATVNRVLAGRVPVSVGLISYPLYLWHWPLLSYAYIIRRGHPPTALMGVGLICASLLLASLTYLWVERPVRGSAHKLRVTVGLALLMGCVGLAGISVWIEGARETRNDDRGGVDMSKINRAVGDGVFQATPDMHVTRLDGLTVARIGYGSSSILMMGDSLMYQFGPRVQALYDAGQLRHAVYFLVGPSCAPIPDATRQDRYATCSQMPEAADCAES